MLCIVVRVLLQYNLMLRFEINEQQSPSGICVPKYDSNAILVYIFVYISVSFFAITPQLYIFLLETSPV